MLPQSQSGFIKFECTLENQEGFWPSSPMKTYMHYYSNSRVGKNGLDLFSLHHHRSSHLAFAQHHLDAKNKSVDSQSRLNSKYQSLLTTRFVSDAVLKVWKLMLIFNQLENCLLWKYLLLYFRNPKITWENYSLLALILTAKQKSSL